MRFIVPLALVFSASLCLCQRGNRPRSTLSAPTYYVAIKAQRSEPAEIHFRGASNLPSGAKIYIQVSSFYQGGWSDYSDPICVDIDGHGFFEGNVHPKGGMKFDNNLILRAVFETQLCHQSGNTIRTLGKHGERLANVEDPLVPYTELYSHSRNPQLYQVSGWYYGLEAFDRVLTGGSWSNR